MVTDGRRLLVTDGRRLFVTDLNFTYQVSHQQRIDAKTPLENLKDKKISGCSIWFINGSWRIRKLHPKLYPRDNSKS